MKLVKLMYKIKKDSLKINKEKLEEKKNNYFIKINHLN